MLGIADYIVLGILAVCIVFAVVISLKRGGGCCGNCDACRKKENCTDNKL